MIKENNLILGKFYNSKTEYTTLFLFKLFTSLNWSVAVAQRVNNAFAEAGGQAKNSNRQFEWDGRNFRITWPK